jgi:hypothetical protein
MKITMTFTMNLVTGRTQCSSPDEFCGGDLAHNDPQRMLFSPRICNTTTYIDREDPEFNVESSPVRKSF